jgi:hypothetical protein
MKKIVLTFAVLFVVAMQAAKSDSASVSRHCTKEHEEFNLNEFGASNLRVQLRLGLQQYLPYSF